jgi:hypothetical protein
MLVTGGPPNFSGGGIPPAHDRELAVGADIAHNRRGVVREHAGHRRQVADVAGDDAEQRDDRSLVRGDRVEVCTSIVVPKSLASTEGSSQTRSSTLNFTADLLQRALAGNYSPATR